MKLNDKTLLVLVTLLIAVAIIGIYHQASANTPSSSHQQGKVVESLQTPAKQSNPVVNNSVSITPFTPTPTPAINTQSTSSGVTVPGDGATGQQVALVVSNNQLTPARIILKENVQTQLTIQADKATLLYIPDFSIHQPLTKGNNSIVFIPNQLGIFPIYLGSTTTSAQGYLVIYAK